MLGKLIKYEFKATYRIFVPFLAALAGVSGIAKLFMALSSYFDGPVTAVLASATLLLYELALVATMILPFIISIVRFYKNLVTDEGYLSFTLPVTPMQHIMCKLLTSLVWCAAGAAVAVGSFILLIAGTEDLSVILKVVTDLCGTLVQIYGLEGAVMTAEAVLLLVFGLLSEFTVFYLCIALGQMLFKNKLLGSLAVFGIYYVASQVLGLILAIVSVSAVTGESASIHIVLGGLAAVNAGLFFTGLFVTDHIFKKRLNLA